MELTFNQCAVDAHWLSNYNVEVAKDQVVGFFGVIKDKCQLMSIPPSYIEEPFLLNSDTSLYGGCI